MFLPGILFVNVNAWLPNTPLLINRERAFASEHGFTVEDDPTVHLTPTSFAALMCARVLTVGVGGRGSQPEYATSAATCPTH